MNNNIISHYFFGDMCIIFYKNKSTVSLMIVPKMKFDTIRQSKLEQGDSLLQLYLTGDEFTYGYSQGISMRNSPALSKFSLVRQECNAYKNGYRIVSIFERDDHQKATHFLTWSGGKYLSSQVDYFNGSSRDIELQMISSFSLTGITPFVDGEAPGSLQLHRMRSYWSEEGRLLSEDFEELGLAASWASHNVKSERYGQAGTMPVRKYFPFGAIEDKTEHVIWAAQIAWAGSWQMEIYRRGNAVSMSGGLADMETGHFKKILRPGESIQTPEAYLTVAEGGVDLVCARLLEAQKDNLDVPEIEQELPVMYNEYCDTWGDPTQEKVEKQLTAAKSLGLKYFVIDAGWYASDRWDSSIGSWDVSREKFPDGLKKTADHIREAGLVPGLWFEFENVGVNSSIALQEKAHLLTRDNYTIVSGERAFWNFCDPWVQDYLSQKVINFLRENGFEYIKVDYNDTYGIGCDGAESYGEALRQQVIEVQNFFRKIKEEIPGIIIENCASGGHRLEPSMMALSSMASFSDAHECSSIPIIAANLHRAILPRQSQIWAVLHSDDSDRRLVYSLVNTFLGRMCLSGSIAELSEKQKAIVRSAIAFYRKAYPVISEGISLRYGTHIGNYNAPEGWQCVVRFSGDGMRALITFHMFGGKLPESVELNVPELSQMRIISSFGEANAQAFLNFGRLTFETTGNFTAQALLLERK